MVFSRLPYMGTVADLQCCGNNPKERMESSKEPESRLPQIVTDARSEFL